MKKILYKLSIEQNMAEKETNELQFCAKYARVPTHAYTYIYIYNDILNVNL